MNNPDNRGSVLILVLIAALILSLIGLSALTQSGTEIGTARNFMTDKSAFYAADAGVQWGIKELRNPTDPDVKSPNELIIDEKTFGDYVFYSGHLEDTTSQTITGFKGFLPPMPVGMSIEMSGAVVGASTKPWQMTISAKPKDGKSGARKEIRAVVVTLVNTEY